MKGWPTARLSLNELKDAFASDDGIGVILGDASGGLVDVDIDAEEALTAAGVFLPETDRAHGRESKMGSHRFYLVNPVPAPEQFVDVDGTMLIEIRSTGQQTLIPPTIHPSGERIRWEDTGDPGHVDAETLRCAVRKVAAHAILARHWANKGQRHECSKALCGVLLRAGWSEDEVVDFLEQVSKSSGRDDEWATRKSDVRTTAKRLAQERPATGLPRLREILGNDVVTKLADWLDLPTETIQVSSMLERFAATLPQWPHPPKEDAFCGLAGELVSMVEPHSEADPSALLSQFLVGFGNVIGRSAHVRVEADKHFTNLFAVLVGPTSKARKGSALSQVKRLLREADPYWVDNCMASGLSSGEGLIWAVRDPVYSKDGSKLLDAGVEDKRLLAVETEFAQQIKRMGRESNVLSTILRQAWDNGNLRTLTKNSPAQATGAHIAMIAHITQTELRRYLGETEMASGFGNRFLWLCVKRSKVLPEGGKLTNQDLLPLTRQLATTINWARRVKEVRRSSKARKLWADVYPQLSEGNAGLMGAVTSRAEAQVIRLALIYALLDRSSKILTKHLNASLAFWDYAEASARFIFGDSLGDPTADAILQALRANPNGLTRTAISNLFGGHRKSGDISRALVVLSQSGLASCRPEPTGGRPDERWSVLAEDAKNAKKD